MLGFDSAKSNPRARSEGRMHSNPTEQPARGERRVILSGIL